MELKPKIFMRIPEENSGGNVQSAGVYGDQQFTIGQSEEQGAPIVFNIEKIISIKYNKT